LLSFCIDSTQRWKMILHGTGRTSDACKMDIRYPEKAKRMVFVSKWINSFINILDGSSIRRFQAFFHIRVVDASASIILLVIVSR
jgi:hypothetical protein